MENVTIQFSEKELHEVMNAFNTIRHFFGKAISPNELYQERFLTGLMQAREEVETGQVEEVMTFDEFIS